MKRGVRKPEILLNSCKVRDVERIDKRAGRNGAMMLDGKSKR